MSIIIISDDVNRLLRNYQSKESRMVVTKRKKNKFHIQEGMINYPVTLKPEGIICSCSPAWCIHRIKVILSCLRIPNIYLYFYSSENWQNLYQSKFSSDCIQNILDENLNHDCPICLEELTRPKKGLGIQVYQCHECKKLTCQSCITKWTNKKIRKEDKIKITSCPHCRAEKPPSLPV